MLNPRNIDVKGAKQLAESSDIVVVDDVHIVDSLAWAFSDECL